MEESKEGRGLGWWSDRRDRAGINGRAFGEVEGGGGEEKERSQKASSTREDI